MTTTEVSPATPGSAHPPLALGIVGCGAVTHLNYAKPLVGRTDYGVRYVFDLVQEQAASAARLFGAEIAPLDRLVAESDAVVIGTPPPTHAALVRECLRPGSVVICEKPFMLTAADARASVELARSLDARLYVFHHRRTYPQVELARELVGLGLIGEITGLTAREGGRLTWQTVSNYLMRDPQGGGVVWDIGSHVLDMALYAARLDGDEGAAVTVTSVERDRPEPSHWFRSRFALSTGGRQVDCGLELSRTDALPNMVVVHGTRGSLGFVTDRDRRVRVWSGERSTVLVAERDHEFLDSVGEQFQRMLLREGDEEFAAERFVTQVAILEAIAHG